MAYKSENKTSLECDGCEKELSMCEKGTSYIVCDTADILEMVDSDAKNIICPDLNFRVCKSCFPTFKRMLDCELSISPGTTENYFLFYEKKN